MTTNHQRNTTTPRSPRTYTDEQRAEALHLSSIHGATAAADLLGIPVRTVRHWAQTATEDVRALIGKFDESLLPNVEPGRGWQRTKPHLVDALANAATEAMQAVRQAIEEDRARDARDYSIVFGVLADKALLIGGPVGVDIGGRYALEDGRRGRVAGVLAEREPVIPRTPQTEAELAKTLDMIERHFREKDAAVIEAEGVERPPIAEAVSFGVRPVSSEPTLTDLSALIEQARAPQPVERTEVIDRARKRAREEF